MRISDWSSDVCASDLLVGVDRLHQIRRDHDHQLSLVALPPVRAEQRAEHRHVAEPRRLFDCVRAAVAEQPGDDEALARAEFDRRLGAPRGQPRNGGAADLDRSEEHTSELQSLMRISYAVFCLKTNTKTTTN